MQKQLYNKVRAHLLALLFKQYISQDNVLQINDITHKVDEIKKLLSISQSVKDHLFPGCDDESLTEEDFFLLTKELEQQFSVDMGSGVCLSGQKDITWWSNKVKIELEETNYWERFEKYLRSQLPPEVIKTIDEDTDIIMNHLGNPALKEFDIYGMTVGHVQSGKTSNYAALICKAADSGYKFIVVITSNNNSLRNQTQSRINESFIGISNGEYVGVGCFYNDFNTQKQPISLTANQSDFNLNDANRLANGMSFDNINGPILLVIKKDSSILTNLLAWLKNLSSNNNISKHSMLVIDDESDYASINTKDKDAPTPINRKIRALLKIFEKSSYVAYTATPYANIFIDHEAEEKDDVYIKDGLSVNISDDLFPNNFIYALDTPSNYFGARKIFIENSAKHIINIDDFDEILPITHKIDHDLSRLPDSLYDAINLYLLNIATRHLRGQEDKHNTMLIHISRYTDLHARIAFLVNEYLNDIKAEVTSYGKLPNAYEYSQHIGKIHYIFTRYFEENRFNWEKTIHQLVNIIKKVVVREEYLGSKSKIEYRDDIASNIIAVGGMSLSRGFTLEGLSVSYFIRSTIFYDTLMQMGRWFGYRNDYEDLCKIYMPEETQAYFEHITQSTEELMLSFKEMAKENRTPHDFGLAVKQAPNSLLQVTARNKRKHTGSIRHKMNLNGVLKETVRFSKDIQVHRHNFQTMKSFIKDITNSAHTIEKKLIFKNIEKHNIEKFLKDFIVYQNGSLDELMPIKFIQEYAKSIDTLWDVVIYEGQSKQIVNLNNYIIKPEIRNKYSNRNDKDYIEIGNRKISSGTPEDIVLSKEIMQEIQQIDFQKGEKTKFIRKKLERPILMLHILNVPDFFECLPAFGVCFPDNGLDKSQTVEYLINKVEIQRLEKELKFFEGDGDD